MKNNSSIGYDETKKMLNTLRKLSENVKSTQTIREQHETDPDVSGWDVGPFGTPERTNQTKSPKNDLVVINDVEVKLLSSDNMDMTLSEEQKTAISNIIDAFRQQVSELVDFDPGMTVNPEQIRLDGILSDLDFRFTLVAGKDAGLYVICDMTEVTPELIDILTKFNKFYQSYVDAMNNLITQRKNN